MTYEHIESDFIREILINNDTRKESLDSCLDLICEYCQNDFDNKDLPFEVFTFRQNSFESASAHFDLGQYDMCFLYVKEYFSV
jgi:hypothetical protein